MCMWKEGVMSNGEQDHCHGDQKHGRKLEARKQRTVPGPGTSCHGRLCFGREYLEALFSKSAGTNLRKK